LKVEHVKSLFGKFPYLTEQVYIYKALDEFSPVVLAYNPKKVFPQIPESISKFILSREERKKKIRERIEKAKKFLDAIL